MRLAWGGSGLKQTRRPEVVRIVIAVLAATVSLNLMSFVIQ
jgi:hypothetical protein